MTPSHLRLRRSFQYVPPMYAPLLEASRESAADIACFDLEDGTPPASKIEARGIIENFLNQGRPRAHEVLIRVNTLDTQWGHDDLAFAARLGVDGVLLPKVEGDGVARQAQAVLAAHADKPPALWCMIETPLGVLRAEQVASAGGVEGFVVGSADLAEGLQASHTEARLPLWHALSQILLVARAFGLTAIDAIYANSADEIAMDAACRQSMEMGFDGKSVVSASSVAIANRIFSPSEEAIAKAQAAIEGKGGYGGHIAQARRILERHALITRSE